MVEVTWTDPETAPRDRLILADMGMPWVALAIWNEPSGQWCVTELECGPFEGVWSDTAISHTFEAHRHMRGWCELPALPGCDARLGKEKGLPND